MRHRPLLRIVAILGLALVPATEGRAALEPLQRQGADRYIELMVAVDRTRWESFGSHHAMTRHLQQIVASVNARLDSLETDVTGELELVLSKVVVLCEAPEFTPDYPDPRYSPGEVDPHDLLNDFSVWRRSSGSLSNYNVYLTGQELHGPVTSYGTASSMCSTNSATVVQSQYDANRDAGSIARDLGLALGIRLDGQGNACPPTGFVMASAGDPGREPPTTYSSCSRTYVDQFFRDRGDSLSCLDNVPDRRFSLTFVGCD